MASYTNNTTDNGVVVLIKGKKCGYCQRLTPHVPEIKKRVESMGMKLIEYEVDDMWLPPNGEKGQYPKIIGYVGMWYPFIFYVSSNNWKALKEGQDVRGEMKILNGNFNGKKYGLGEQKYNPINPDHVDKWLEEVTSKTTITNAVVAPRTLSSLGTPKKAPNTYIDKNKIDTKMKIIPRRKYGR